MFKLIRETGKMFQKKGALKIQTKIGFAVEKKTDWRKCRQMFVLIMGCY